MPMRGVHMKLKLIWQPIIKFAFAIQSERPLTLVGVMRTTDDDHA